MTSFNPGSDCGESRTYYFAYLSEELKESIPAGILLHIESCDYCLGEIGRLEAAIKEKTGGSPPDSMMNVKNLNLHFAFTGVEVRCRTVKAFLPILADPAFNPMIPTPITVHIDKCGQCGEDLEAIRQMGLRGGQLSRLSRLFIEEPVPNCRFCEEIEELAESAVVTLEGVSRKAMEHLYRCRRCRAVLYQKRQRLFESLPQKAQMPQSICNSVLAADIFNYVVPAQTPSLLGQYSLSHEWLGSHFCQCPVCLNRIQEMHETLYGICERGNSSIATIYNIEEACPSRRKSKDNIYAEFPISVKSTDTIRGERIMLSTPISEAAGIFIRRASAINFKPFLTAALLSAAIIIFVSALFLHNPTAKAGKIDHIYQALEKVKTIHKKNCVPNAEEPVYEIWASRMQNLYLIKTGEQIVLWDIANQVRKIKDSVTSPIKVDKLTDEKISLAKKLIDNSIIIMPFYRVTDIPEGAMWSSLSDENLNIPKNIEAYGLVWTDNRNSHFPVINKWRIFINRETYLPQKIEWYQQKPDEDGYKLTNIIQIGYESEIDAVRKEFGL